MHPDADRGAQRQVELIYSIALTLPLVSRYDDSKCTVNDLYTLCRTQQKMNEKLGQHVLRSPSTGLSARLRLRVTEFQTSSGLPHDHIVLYRALTQDTESCLRRLQNRDKTLTYPELAQLLEIAMGAITASTSAEELAMQFPQLDEPEEVARMCLKYQVHSCTSTCRPKKGRRAPQTCRFFFPRMPSLFDIMARAPGEGAPELLKVEALHVKIRNIVKHIGEAVANDSPAGLADLLHCAAGGLPVPDQVGGYVWADIKFTQCEELERELARSRLLSDDEEVAVTLGIYHYTLHFRRHGKFVPKRKASQAFVENFNPFVMLASDGNVSTDFVGHTVDKLYKYVTKGSQERDTDSKRQSEVDEDNKGLRSAEKETRRRNKGVDSAAADMLKAKIEEKFWREVTTGEALYLLDPSLHLSSANFSVVRVCTRPRADDGAGSRAQYRAYAARYVCPQNCPVFERLVSGR